MKIINNYDNLSLNMKTFKMNAESTGILEKLRNQYIKVYHLQVKKS
jgi:hypothetical protein